MTVRVSVLAPRMVDEGILPGITIDAYANALAWLTRGMGRKTIVLTNNSALGNSLTFQVLASADYLLGMPAEVIAPAPVVAGDIALITLNNAYDLVIVQVKSTVAGNPATYQLDYNGVGEA
jgi:hypothetical protein